MFANIGGFVLRYAQRAEQVDEHRADNDKTGVEYDAREEDPQPRQRQVVKEKWPFGSITLTGSNIKALRSRRMINTLPRVNVYDMTEKSRGGDAFARVIAVAQILWAAIQVISRGARGLSISQLEIAVLAFAVCAILIYIGNWKKPQGFETPITLLDYDVIPLEILHVLEESRNDTQYGILTRIMPGSITDAQVPYFLSMVMVGAGIFRGIHVAAWNFKFPTDTEQLLWRIASVYSPVGLLVLLLPLYQYSTGMVITPLPQYLMDMVIILTIFLYVVSRLFLLVEIFWSLCFLPPDAYVTTFASTLPHVA
jgi:hypothetical protein